MMAKIEWYQEILEQEPGSRVFFPLARLLIAADRKEEAAETLRKGLERHPDFLEARLELITLLHEGGFSEHCAREVEDVVKLFKACPAFWEAWAQTEQGSDLALAIDFIAQSARFPELTWRHIVERGLAAGAQHKHGVSSGFAQLRPAAASAEKHLSAGSVAGDRAEVLPGVPSGSMPPAGKVKAGGTPFSGAATAQRTDFALQVLEKAPVIESDTEDGGLDDLVTLRTRSMADVLAEQGDLAGALEIYQELEAAAPTPEEAEVLRERVMALADRVSAQPEIPAAKDVESLSVDDVAVPASPSKMLTLLETLADRLEARARG